MSKSDKYDGKPKPSDARRMMPDENARQKKSKAKNKSTKRPHKWWGWGGNFGRFMHSFPNKCFVKPVYCEEFDAYYCPKCMVWLEGPCSDKECQYCTKRPGSPKKIKHAG